MSEIPSYLVSGEVARLIPIVSDSAREQRSASILLAGMRSVFELRKALLKSVNVRVGSRTNLEVWTEVVFASEGKKDQKSKDRPDGLLVLKTGKREWRALIEAKVRNDDIGEEQLSRYVQQAKSQGIDAVITITNQFAALPTHHPVQLPRNKTKNVDIFHWSWTFVKTQCALLLKNDGVEDSSQQFILQEIQRYFESDRAGINQFDQMNSEWKEVVNKVKSNAPLLKTSDEVQNTIAAWHQEQRDLCLNMSRLTHSEVSLKLKKAHRTDPAKRLKDDADDFTKNHVLTCTIDIQHAAADLEVTADLQRRMIYCSMRLTAPKDRKSTKARTNWLLRQLKETKPTGFFIRAIRPGKAEPTYEALQHLLDEPDLLESEHSNTTATAFEVVYQVDLAGKFAGNRVFIDELEKAVPHFYQEAGQKLKAWTPPPPKIKRKSEQDSQVEHQNDPSG